MSFVLVVCPDQDRLYAAVDLVEAAGFSALTTDSIMRVEELVGCDPISAAVAFGGGLLSQGVPETVLALVSLLRPDARRISVGYPEGAVGSAHHVVKDYDGDWVSLLGGTE